MMMDTGECYTANRNGSWSWMKNHFKVGIKLHHLKLFPRWLAEPHILWNGNSVSICFLAVAIVWWDFDQARKREAVLRTTGMYVTTVNI